MPYVRPTIKYAYNCPNCDTWFIEGSFGCGIIHMAGDCCHYGEQKLAVKILGMVGGGRGVSGFGFKNNAREV